MYFPDEVFRNIASYNFDPYKQDRAKHAAVWQKIRVKRLRFIDNYQYTEGDDIVDGDETYEDQYYVFINNSIDDDGEATIPTTFLDFDNLKTTTEYYIDDEYTDYQSD